MLPRVGYKKRKKKPPVPKDRQLNINLSEPQLEIIKANAAMYKNGNLSEWVRYAALVHRPTPGKMRKWATMPRPIKDRKPPEKPVVNPHYGVEDE